MKFLTGEVRVKEIKDLSEVWAEIKPLLEAHWEEVAAFKDEVKLDVWVDRYQALLELGIIRLYVAFKDANIVAYSSYVVQPNLHYKRDIFACNDVIFVTPELRGTMLAFRLVEHCEEELKKLGASVVTYHMKVYAPFESLMKATGYKHIEHLYGKKL